MMPFIKHFEHLQIQLQLIKSATNDFSDDHCIGKGGFGNVYKGELALSKGQTMVAIKRLNRAFGQGDPEFWKEVIMLSLYKHENIVSLLGFCDDTSRLPYEQFSAFLANAKELNSQKQSKEVTLQKAEEIFGPGNNDLYAIFEGLVTHNFN